ncbi:MAG: hypothetical protein ACKOD9_19870, partial [Rubrivivax sp.]
GVGSEFAIVFPCAQASPDPATSAAPALAGEAVCAVQAPAERPAAAGLESSTGPNTASSESTLSASASNALDAALQDRLPALDQALQAKMMKARQLAEDIQESLQGTVWAGSFAPIVSEVQKLRFNEARENLWHFSQQLQTQGKGESGA